MSWPEAFAIVITLVGVAWAIAGSWIVVEQIRAGKKFGGVGERIMKGSEENVGEGDKCQDACQDICQAVCQECQMVHEEDVIKGNKGDSGKEGS